MLYCYPRGIARSPYFIEDRATLAEYLISQELTRERGVLKYRLRKAGIPFDPDSATEELAKLIPGKPTARQEPEAEESSPPARSSLEAAPSSSGP